jgi:hypothetical protein
MPIATKTTTVIGLLIIAATSACAVSPGQQTSAGGSGTGTPGTGSSSQQTPITSKTPRPNSSTAASSPATEPNTQNGVVLGPAFGCPPAGVCYFSFGWVPLGRSTQQQLVISMGLFGKSATVQAVSISGHDTSLPQEFEVTDNPCIGHVVQQSDPCTISITFTPQRPGFRGAQLSVTTDPKLLGMRDLGGFGGSGPSPSIHVNPTQPTKLAGTPTPSPQTPAPSSGAPTSSAPVSS